MKTLLTLSLTLLCGALLLPLHAGAATDITGKWQFVLNTEGGDRTAAASFQLDGQKVTGKWGDANADVAGTFADGKLDLAFPYTSDEVGPGTMKITGQFDGDALTGKWEFQDYSGTFKATRPQ
jgi:hypothetical protein